MESVVVPRPARVARPGLPSGTIVAPVPPVDVGTDADTATDLPADTGADLPADTAAHLPADTTAHLPADTVADLPAGVVAYLRELAAVDARARQAAAAQRAVLEERHPAPGRLHEVPDGDRLWERRPGDADFVVLRAAAGAQRASVPVVAPAVPDGADPGCVEALRQCVERHAVVPGLPVAIDLRAFRRVRLRGDRARATALARALLAQAAVFHAPHELWIETYLFGPEWAWVEALPHAWRLGGAAHRIIAANGPSTRDVPEHLTYLEFAEEPAADRTDLLLDVAADGALTASTPHGPVPVGVADALSVAGAARVAARLTPLRLDSRSRGPEAAPELDDLLAEAGHGPYRVPVGVSADGTPVFLDLRQAAEGGDGPHGLIAGATGSGKSELLRAIVAGLAVTHRPDQVTFLLVEYLGNDLGVLGRLPHSAGVTTDLPGSDGRLDRLGRVVEAELRRRAALLRRAGAADRTGYERARAAGTPAEPMPLLVLVCDEVDELLAAHPAFAGVLARAGRVGRALGVHLLLASQRPEPGWTRELDGHLSYRVGLRMFSGAASVAALGVPDAALLPRAPGHALLVRAGDRAPVRFRAAFASGRRAAATPPGYRGTLLEQIVDRLAATVPPVRPLWPPPPA